MTFRAPRVRRRRLASGFGFARPILLQTKGCARIMNVTTPEKRWSDDRLDDLKETVEDGFARADTKMDDGFARVDADIRELRGELKSEANAIRGELKSEVGDLRTEMNTRFDKVDARFDKVDTRFEKVDARFEKVDARFDKLNERFSRQNWGLFAAAVVIIAAMLGPHPL